MAHGNTLLAYLPEYFAGQDTLLAALLVCALFATFGWSVLGRRLKLAICFIVGAFLFKILFDQLIDKRLFPDLHSYLPFVLGSITAGLLEIGAFLLADRTMVIGIFFGGAAFPLICFAHAGNPGYAGSLAEFPWLALTASVLFTSLAVFKITRLKACPSVLSAIAGGIGVVCLSSLSDGASNWRLLEVDGLRYCIDLLKNNRIPGVICLAISGLLVQSLLHLALGHARPPKTERLNAHPEGSFSENHHPESHGIEIRS